MTDAAGKEAHLKCKCGAPATLAIEDETTASIHCPRGHRVYLFKRENGKWETQMQRQRRLNKYRVCGQCEAEYILSDHVTPYYAEAFPDLCTECIKPHIKGRQFVHHLKLKIANNNPGSPWRKWVRRGRSAA